jgi:hypothetical protein
MKPVSVIGATALQVATHPVSVLRVRGNFNGNTNPAWLHIFDATAAPADGTAPMVAAIPLYQTTGFYAAFEVGALQFTKGCYVCVSTTQATKTLSTDTMDVTVELDEPEYPTGTTFVGDLTTPVTGLQVWTEAAGATARKKLFSLEVDGTNLTGAQFIQIFAKDTVNTGDVPVISIPIAAGAVKTGSSKLTFGADGSDIFSIDSTSAATKRLGCTIKISSTAPGYTAANGTAAIKAEYK